MRCGRVSTCIRFGQTRCVIFKKNNNKRDGFYYNSRRQLWSFNYEIIVKYQLWNNVVLHVVVAGENIDVSFRDIFAADFHVSRDFDFCFLSLFPNAVFVPRIMSSMRIWLPSRCFRSSPSYSWFVKSMFTPANPLIALHSSRCDGIVIAIWKMCILKTVFDHLCAFRLRLNYVKCVRHIVPTEITNNRGPACCWWCICCILYVVCEDFIDWTMCT